jgi:hypothetical protein
MPGMRDPSASAGLAIPNQVKANEMYFGTLEAVECRPYAGPPRYNEDGSVKQSTSIVWMFGLRDHSRVQRILKDDGSDYQQWSFTSDATSKGSRGRDMMEALAGREITDTEVQQLLAADPDHMPTKLVRKSCLLVMGTYKKENGQQGIGINQVLPLSQSDKDRLKQALAQEKAAGGVSDLPWEQAGRMGPSAPPPQQWTQQGIPVAPQRQAPRPVAVVAPPQQAEEDEDAPF